MDKQVIESEARKLQVQIWTEHRATRCSDAPITLSELVSLFDPEVAAYHLGVGFEYHEKIVPFGVRNVNFEIAGLIDRQAGKIAISRKFSAETIRFTGAHEIGHWILHPQQVLHRDRPIKGLASEISRRLPQEQEADYFAACFLMPRKLVQQSLENIFNVKVPFEFNEQTSFWLCPSDPESLLWPENSLDRALALASVNSYRGKHFTSLAKQFQVSSASMAIRLQELNLVAG
ncbi:MAG: ImmA/IrrE family metallo-endopeptidase [Gallionella sp.]|nr:ImmA/IrrE family metallo-endopeptidase [Gallionella sp.]